MRLLALAPTSNIPPPAEMISLRPYLQHLLVIAGTVCTVSVACLAETPPITAAQSEFFESHIRPVLVEHCYDCHNSSEVAEGGLVLDHRQGLLKGGDSGTLLVAGQPSQSRLIAILKHEVEGMEMPKDGPKLSDAIIADFERWIAMGAPDPRQTPPSTKELSGANSWEATLRRRKQWWSFQPIVDPVIPDSDGHPIDRFIRARLSELELEPSSPAPPSVLIRRLYLALIGLPPTVSELSDWTVRFEKSDDPSTVTETLIDHLLASDHFGEKWARHWMDWIRYAESHGSEGDPGIDNAWLYRDYLIRALNADIPFDQLVREHVAGDLLKTARINEQMGINESVIGTAQWRMVFHGFAPTDALEEKVRFVDDQVNAFSKAFLGLTVSCARCHDHKFDAISQRDYYALFGILAACRPGRTAIDLPDRQNRNSRKLTQLKPRIRDEIADAWLQSLPALPSRLLKSLKTSRVADSETVNRVPQESLLHPIMLLGERRGSEFREGWRRLAESAIKSDETDIDQATGEPGIIRRWHFTERSVTADWNVVGTGLAGQPSASGAFAIAPDGDAVLSGIYPAGIYSHLISDKHAARLTSPDIGLNGESEVWLRVIGDGESSTRYVVQDYPRNGTVYPVKQLNPQWTWQRFDLSYWSGDNVYFEIVTSKDAPLLVRESDRSWFGVSDVRLVKKGAAAPTDVPSYLVLLAYKANAVGQPGSLDELASLYQSAIGDALVAWRSGSASDAQSELLSACMQTGLLTNSLSDLISVAPLIEEYRRLEAEIQVPIRVPSLEETAGRTQSLLVRGNHHTPGEVVPRRFLEAVDTSEYGYQSSGRRQLAEDLLRDDNPLTRRVIVNRIWHHLFGRGIVATPDNLGRMGESPTHPELLDWLACRLVEDNWSLKSLIRRMVMSQTWQQSSRPSIAATQIDPGNQFLSHANLRRLEAEAIRDSLLATSGTLDRRLYGPPIGGDANRRSIYVSVIRNSLDPFLRSFDFPEPFSASGRRDVTNVPAQSLTLMNDPTVTRWATALADSVTSTSDAKATENEVDRARVQQLFLTLLSRSPSRLELDQAIDYLRTTRDAHQRTTAAQQHLTKEINQAERTIESTYRAVRDRLESERAVTLEPIQPEPIARWDFEEGLNDSIGGLVGTAHGGARIEKGRLVLGHGAYVTTTAVKESLREKTLEAWVQLENLDQRGGGVMSLQFPDGSVFDSIVFGERQDRHWLAGSDFHRRTKDWGGPAEQEANHRTVHLAITYHSDGRIVGYRDGVPYGSFYQSSPPVPFEQGKAIVSFGVRHLPAGGNRLLRGRVERAALYNRALSDSEIIASFKNAGGGISQRELRASMSQEQRTQLETATQRLSRLQADLQALGAPHEPLELAAWTELTRALLLLKEMIYVP